MSDNDLIRRMDAVQATRIAPSDEWMRATKGGYELAATDCMMNILKIPPAAPMLAPAVRVKPLVWEEQPGKSYRQANSPFGQYQISFLVEFECWQLCRPHKAGDDWGSSFSRHSHKDEAKAAAQADYEARFRAGLAEAPAEPLGADWMRERAAKRLLELHNDTLMTPDQIHALGRAAERVDRLPGPTPADLLAHALRLPEVARLVKATAALQNHVQASGLSKPEAWAAFVSVWNALSALEGGKE